MKRISIVLAILSLVLMSTTASSLQLIGTASYDSDGDGTAEEYNLIHMEDGPFGPITWLDYSNGRTNWNGQVAWATGLGSELTVTLDPFYTTNINWNEGWRLPIVDQSKIKPNGEYGYEGPNENGYYNYDWGDNMINGEMNYLYFIALGNKDFISTDGTFHPPGWGFKNTGDFDQLVAYSYWAGTERFSNAAWSFMFSHGSQIDELKSERYYGIAVHPGVVSTVPEPLTVLLLGSGLAGLGVWRISLKRRFK